MPSQLISNAEVKHPTTVLCMQAQNTRSWQWSMTPWVSILLLLSETLKTKSVQATMMSQNQKPRNRWWIMNRKEIQFKLLLILGQSYSTEQCTEIICVFTKQGMIELSKLERCVYVIINLLPLAISMVNISLTGYWVWLQLQAIHHTSKTFSIKEKLKINLLVLT